MRRYIITRVNERDEWEHVRRDTWPSLGWSTADGALRAKTEADVTGWVVPTERIRQEKSEFWAVPDSHSTEAHLQIQEMAGFATTLTGPLGPPRGQDVWLVIRELEEVVVTCCTEAEARQAVEQGYGNEYVCKPYNILSHMMVRGFKPWRVWFYEDGTVNAADQGAEHAVLDQWNPKTGQGDAGPWVRLWASDRDQAILWARRALDGAKADHQNRRS